MSFPFPRGPLAERGLSLKSLQRGGIEDVEESFEVPAGKIGRLIGKAKLASL